MEKTSPQSLEPIQRPTTEPEVSILMLTYNRANYIKEAISSVVAQKYSNWKLFIIDDGSSDDTDKIVTSFLDPRINYIRHTENRGLFERRKESLQYATSAYTAVLDSDDYWTSPDKLGTQVAWLEQNSDHVLIGTFTKLINAAGEDIGVDTFKTTDMSIRKNILLRNQFTHSAVLMRSDAIRQTEGYLPTLAEDLDLFLQLGQHGKLANIPEVLTAHRIHGNSANDRGVKMAWAVHRIILRRGEAYPRRRLALWKSHLRTVIGLLRQFLFFKVSLSSLM